MRPASDTVVLILAVGISATLMIAAAGIVMVTLLQPERDLTATIDAMSRLLTVIVGVIVGYLAGLRRPEGRR